MAQQKKKPSSHEKEKLARAQHQNMFLGKLKYMIGNICGEELCKSIPQRVLETVYQNRCRGIKFFEAEGHTIQNDIMKSIQELSSRVLKAETVTIAPYTFKISLEEYFTYSSTVCSIYAHTKNTDFPQADKVKAALHQYATDWAPHQLVSKRFDNIIFTIGCIHCSLEKGLYWLKHELKQSTVGGLHNNVEIYKEVPETKSVAINGTHRPVTKLGWAFASGMRWVNIKPSVFSIKGHFAEIPMPVYFQAHALQRLSERIDCLPLDVLQVNMYSSFYTPHICYDNHHQYLLEFSIFGVKAGYFRVDIIEGIIVARTFLFVTNNGTPEGQKLEKNTKLQKLDKNYLAIDKLSTFMTSDIGNNEEIKKIFQDAGCQCLIDLYVKFDNLCIKHPSQATTTLMLDYLGKGTTLIPDELCKEPVL